MNQVGWGVFAATGAEHVVRIVSCKYPVEGGAILFDFRKLYVRVLDAAEEVAPVGQQENLIVAAPY